MREMSESENTANSCYHKNKKEIPQLALFTHQYQLRETAHFVRPNKFMREGRKEKRLACDVHSHCFEDIILSSGSVGE